MFRHAVSQGSHIRCTGTNRSDNMHADTTLASSQASQVVHRVEQGTTLALCDKRAKRCADWAKGYQRSNYDGYDEVQLINTRQV